MERISRLVGSRGPAFWLFLFFVVLPGIPFVLGTLGVALYTWWPIPLDRVEVPTMDANVEHIVLLAHGLEDSPASWSADVAHSFASTDPATGVVPLDWRPYSDDTFRCSVDGMRIGEQIGGQWSRLGALASIHLIGHSCGAFVVQGLCEAVAAARPEVQIQATFLDPVAIYGGFFWEYGIDRFGDCADFAEAYIDTGDGVPGSNVALPHTHTFDVTSARPADFDASPHVWPTAYYARLARRGRQPELRAQPDLGERHPRGETSGPLPP